LAAAVGVGLEKGAVQGVAERVQAEAEERRARAKKRRKARRRQRATRRLVTRARCWQTNW
jgi:hypothetical protein